MDKTGQFDLWDILVKESPAEDVKINGAVNVHSSPISNYEVALSYGDLTLIIAVLRDYVKGLDKLLEENTLPIDSIEYEAYYRKKFMQIADRISKQIDYDYDEQCKKCLKKMGKANSSDIGEDALVLALR